jgi:hypothetical protein
MQVTPPNKQKKEEDYEEQCSFVQKQINNLIYMQASSFVQNHSKSFSHPTRNKEKRKKESLILIKNWVLGVY